MHEDPRAVTHAVLRLLAGAVMISFAPVFVRVTDVPPTVVAVYRTLIGGLLLLGWVLVRGGRLRVGGRVLLALGLAGVAFGVDLAMWHRSIWYIGPGLATLLANFQVFVLAITGVMFFGERLHARLVISIVLAVAGLGLIVGPRWDLLAPQYRWGVILGLLTAGAYAVYILSLRWAATHAAARHHARGASGQQPAHDPARDLALSSLVSAACLSASALVEGQSLAIASLRDAGLLAGYAVVAQVLGGMLIISALGQVPASRVGLILLLQPALALVWDVLFFARPVMIREIAGAMVALVAIYLGTRAGNRSSTRPSTRPDTRPGPRRDHPDGPPAGPAARATEAPRSAP